MERERDRERDGELMHSVRRVNVASGVKGGRLEDRGRVLVGNRGKREERSQTRRWEEGRLRKRKRGGKYEELACKGGGEGGWSAERREKREGGREEGWRKERSRGAKEDSDERV
jgi:hypothetical protein